MHGEVSDLLGNIRRKMKLSLKLKHNCLDFCYNLTIPRYILAIQQITVIRH